jgi:hypothetical protein
MPVYMRNQSPRDRTKGQPELAGGYKVGDTVVSSTAVHGLDYTRGSVAVGDVGVVLGPATNRRVSVQFKTMSASINIPVTNIHREGQEPERVEWFVPFGPLVFLVFFCGTTIPVFVLRLVASC